MWLLWLSASMAQTPLTYEEALREALVSNPSLRAARLTREGASASVFTSRGIFDPMFAANGSWGQSQTRGFFQGFPFKSDSKTWDAGLALSGSAFSGTSYALNAGMNRNFSSFVTDFGGLQSEQTQEAITTNMNVSVTQQLLKGIKFSYNLQNITKARVGLTIADLQAERAQQEALAQTAQAYWTWAYQERLQSIAEESLAAAKESLRINRLKFEAGEISPLALTRIEAASVQAQGAVVDAKMAAEQTEDALLMLIGKSPSDSYSAATQPGEVTLTEVQEQAAIEVALAQNVDLLVSRANVDGAQLDTANAKHALLPSLSITGAAGIRSQDTTVGASVSGLADEDAFPFVSVSGQFSVPLGNRAARGEAKRLSVQVQQQQRTLQDLEASVAAEVAQQVRVLRSSEQRVALADANLRLAEQTLAAEEALAEVGRSIQKTILEAHAEVDRTRAEAAKARTDYRVAQVMLLKLQGQLSPQLP